MSKISVVINTLNEEKKLPRALASLSGFASEIIVVDMHSSDKTVEIAKKYKAKIFYHKKVGYVEPARNLGIEKCKYDWVFILDADERLTKDLKDYLKKEIKKISDSSPSYYRIPRKNIIFGKWIKHTGWWPDYNIRFFKKGSVSWNQVIHSVPMTTGIGADLDINPRLAIIHNNYSSLEEYLLRMNRYTTIAARNLNKDGIVFSWKSLITKPTQEFLSRYFACEGYRDGIHGLTLSFLQAFSEFVIYAKLWQKGGFERKKISISSFTKEFEKSAKQLKWWQIEKTLSSVGFLKKIWLKTKRRLKYQ